MDQTQLARFTAQLVLCAAALMLAQQVSTRPAAAGWTLTRSVDPGAAGELWCRIGLPTGGYLDHLNQAFWDADAQSPVPLDARGC